MGHLLAVVVIILLGKKYFIKKQVTMLKSNSGFSGKFSGSVSFQPRQIFDLTILKRLKIWLFGCTARIPLLLLYQPLP